MPRKRQKRATAPARLSNSAKAQAVEKQNMSEAVSDDKPTENDKRDMSVDTSSVEVNAHSTPEKKDDASVTSDENPSVVDDDPTPYDNASDTSADDERTDEQTTKDAADDESVEQNADDKDDGSVDESDDVIETPSDSVPDATNDKPAGTDDDTSGTSDDDTNDDDDGADASNATDNTDKSDNDVTVEHDEDSVMSSKDDQVDGSGTVDVMDDGANESDAHRNDADTTDTLTDDSEPSPDAGDGDTAETVTADESDNKSNELSDGSEDNDGEEVAEKAVKTADDRLTEPDDNSEHVNSDDTVTEPEEKAPVISDDYDDIHFGVASGSESDAAEDDAKSDDSVDTVHDENVEQADGGDDATSSDKDTDGDASVTDDATGKNAAQSASTVSDTFSKIRDGLLSFVSSLKSKLASDVDAKNEEKPVTEAETQGTPANNDSAHDGLGSEKSEVGTKTDTESGAVEHDAGTDSRTDETSDDDAVTNTQPESASINEQPQASDEADTAVTETAFTDDQELCPLPLNPDGTIDVVVNTQPIDGASQRRGTPLVPNVGVDPSPMRMGDIETIDAGVVPIDPFSADSQDRANERARFEHLKKTYR